MPNAWPLVGFAPGRGLGDATWMFTASAAVTGGQLVEITGNNMVAPAAAASRKVVGQAMKDAANGAGVEVFLPRGILSATASGAIAAGDQLIPAAAGQVSAHAAGGTVDQARAIIGVAIEAAVNGQAVRFAPPL